MKTLAAPTAWTPVLLDFFPTLELCYFRDPISHWISTTEGLCNYCNWCVHANTELYRVVYFDFTKLELFLLKLEHRFAPYLTNFQQLLASARSGCAELFLACQRWKPSNEAEICLAQQTSNNIKNGKTTFFLTPSKSDSKLNDSNENQYPAHSQLVVTTKSAHTTIVHETNTKSLWLWKMCLIFLHALDFPHDNEKQNKTGANRYQQKQSNEPNFAKNSRKTYPNLQILPTGQLFMPKKNPLTQTFLTSYFPEITHSRA